MGFQLSSEQNNVKFYHKVCLFFYFKIIWPALYLLKDVIEF
jgi:hypothetical protein